MIFKRIGWSTLIVTGVSAFSISVSALAGSCGRLCNPAWVHSAKVEDVRIELEQGADVSVSVMSDPTMDFHKTPFFALTPYFRGATALHFAALLNPHRSVVELLIDSGSNVRATNLRKSTPLHLASGGMGGAARLLILSHLNSRVVNNLKRIDKRSREPSLTEIWLDDLAHEMKIHLSGNNPEIVELFCIDRGSNLDARDFFGSTPLTVQYIEVVKLLVDRGTSIDVTNNKNGTPLHNALTVNPNPAVSQFLIDQGADIHKVSDLGTSLHHAALNWNPEIIKLLLNRGIDIDARNGKMQTPLHLSAANLMPEVARLLLDHGAYLESKDVVGDTPLHLAVRLSRYFVAINLIRRGANIDAKDRYGETSRAVLEQWRKGSPYLKELLEDSMVSGIQ